MIKINNIKITNERFPNGELCLNEEAIKRAVIPTDGVSRIEYYHSNDESIMELYFVVKYIQDIYTEVLRIYFNYLPYSRQDRQNIDTAFTLKYLTDWINTWGIETIVVCEPHSDVAPALLGAVSNPVSEKIFEIVKDEKGFDIDRDIVFFPDAGAQKRYHNISLPSIVGFKHRDWKTGEIMSLEVCGQVPQKPFKAYIIDDLCSFGGTFLHSAKKLRELGASEVYLIVAHCENNILKGELINSGLIDCIYTTDSIFTGQHDLIKIVEV